VSTEFHTAQGPFTLVPLPGLRSSLVWVVDSAGADELFARSETLLSAAIERRSHSLLGKINAEPGRGIFPLAVQTADACASGRIALVGDAAHVVPPIGAQGLNLGLRDGATIAELVADARRQNLDVGSPDVLARYDAQRRTDVASRAFAVDVLNRSLLTDFIPVQGARGLSLYLVERLGPLRRALMRRCRSHCLAAAPDARGNDMTARFMSRHGPRKRLGAMPPVSLPLAVQSRWVAR
jgi:2-octaprenyl-6-methoxyphenol hydroxylase